jgi:NDP-sugar pyrophosphorylase family protein
VNAIVLGAGRGTRLRSVDLRLPKVLVDVDGRPLLAFQLEQLERQGFERVVVNAHHLAHEMESFAARYGGPVDLRVVVEPVLLGTAGGVRNALATLGPEPFLVLYGDVVTTEPLRGLLDAHARGGAAATLAVHEAPGSEGKGFVEVDRDGFVTRFVEKGPPTRDRRLVNSGIYVLEPELVESLPLGVPLDFGYDVFPAAVDSGARIAAHRLARPVVDVGTPEGLAEARSLLRARRADDASAMAKPKPKP